MSKFLKCRYASDHAQDDYKAYCQAKLLKSVDIEAQLARTYPPSYLEWKASKKCGSLALDVSYPNGEYNIEPFNFRLICVKKTNMFKLFFVLKSLMLKLFKMKNNKLVAKY